MTNMPIRLEDIDLTLLRGVRPVTTLNFRFTKHVTIRADGCWLWTSQTRRRVSQYGLIAVPVESVRGPAWRLETVHRLVYEAVNGPIPPGLEILHSCDRPPCVNPAHLRPGTKLENAWDRTSRDRHPRGGRTPGVTLPREFYPIETERSRMGEHSINAKMTDVQVREARERYATMPSVTVGMLAKEHGMSKTGMSIILRGGTRAAAGGPFSAIRVMNPPGKLTPTQVAEIRVAFAAHDGTIHDLGRRYGVAFQTISSIIRGKTWTHIAPDSVTKRPSHRKLTKAQVTKIRQRYVRGVSQARLADDYHVSRAAICMLVRGKTHRVTPPPGTR